MLAQQTSFFADKFNSFSAAASLPNHLESLLSQTAKSAPFILGQENSGSTNSSDEIILEPECPDGVCDFEVGPDPGSWEYCYQYYDPYYCPDQRYYDYETYDKNDLHVMVWTSLWQVGFPVLVFDLLAEKTRSAGVDI